MIKAQNSSETMRIKLVVILFKDDVPGTNQHFAMSYISLKKDTC